MGTEMSREVGDKFVVHQLAQAPSMLANDTDEAIGLGASTIAVSGIKKLLGTGRFSNPILQSPNTTILSILLFRCCNIAQCHGLKFHSKSADRLS